MRAFVWILGVVTALALASPAIHPAPAYASDTTVTVDGGATRVIFEIVKKLWLEMYMIIDRLMDGDRSGGGQTCNCTGGCTCGGGGAGGGGDTTGTGNP